MCSIRDARSAYGVPVISVLFGSSYLDAIVKSAVGAFQVSKRQEEYRVAAVRLLL